VTASLSTSRDVPFERLEALCDAGTLRPIRSDVRSVRMGAKARPGDGVVGGAGLVDGRPVFCFAHDPTYVGGSLGEAQADTIVRVLRLAGRAGAPVVGFVQSGGARLQEGVAGLSGFGRVFREIVALSARVPRISVVAGLSAGGGAYAPALTDFLVMTEDASMFLTGPAVVRDALGEESTAAELGGARVHGSNGVSQFVAPTEADAALLVRDLLGYLPQRAGLAPRAAPPRPPVAGDPGAWVPTQARAYYDVRDVIRRIVDGGELLEVAERWARNIVTGFARIEGRPIGVIANQSRHLGGVLDAQASMKGARFVAKCDAFGLPLVTLVDTPGFLPGVRQERAAVIHHGASLVHSFAAANVPRITVILRKAFGGAAITMNSKDLGADYVFAWPGAQIGVMAARSAARIIHRRDLAVAPDAELAHDLLAQEYAETQLHPGVAARDGFVDEVIAPTETRGRLAFALESLAGVTAAGADRSG
jgi:acetyl-CoA carboxylase carboxyltransferase component